MNVESSITSRPPFEVNYPKSSTRTIDYGRDHPPRWEITPYTNNYPLLRTIGKKKKTTRDNQLYDTYLEHLIVSVKWDYQAKYQMNIETDETMIQIGKNYLRDKATWKVFKLKFWNNYDNCPR